MDTPGDKAIDERLKMIMNTTVTGFLGAPSMRTEETYRGKSTGAPTGPGGLARRNLLPSFPKVTPAVLLELMLLS